MAVGSARSMVVGCALVERDRPGRRVAVPVHLERLSVTVARFAAPDYRRGWIGRQVDREAPEGAVVLGAQRAVVKCRRAGGRRLRRDPVWRSDRQQPDEREERNGRDGPVQPIPERIVFSGRYVDRLRCVHTFLTRAGDVEFRAAIDGCRGLDGLISRNHPRSLACDGPREHEAVTCVRPSHPRPGSGDRGGSRTTARGGVGDKSRRVVVSAGRLAGARAVERQCAPVGPSDIRRRRRRLRRLGGLVWRRPSPRSGGGRESRSHDDP